VSVCLHLLLGLRLCLLWAARPLLVLFAPAVRFVFGLTLSSPHCVTCTVICGCVLWGHRTQLQGELILRCVPGNGDAALEGWAVACASTIIYVSHPLQAFPWRLADPAPTITADWGTRDSTGDGQSLWGLHQSWSWFLQLHLGQDTWRQGESLQFIITCGYELLMDPCVNLGTFTLGSCHQAQEKNQQPHLLDHNPAFPRDPSPVWGVSCGVHLPERGISLRDWMIICMWRVLFLYMWRHWGPDALEPVTLSQCCSYMKSSPPILWFSSSVIQRTQ
jgi:hypothetical protein